MKDEPRPNLSNVVDPGIKPKESLASRQIFLGTICPSADCWALAAISARLRIVLVHDERFNATESLQRKNKSTSGQVAVPEGGPMLF